MSDKAYDPLPTIRSRDLRNNPTDAEKRLWLVLRNRQLRGIRFNRQVPIGPFICDIVARSENLIIEVDGGQHATEASADARRTAYLEGKGYRLIRFWNNDVLGNIDGVVKELERFIDQARTPSPLPPEREGNQSPLPLAGGEEARSAEGEGLFDPTHNPSPSRLRRSSPPAPAGGEKQNQ